MMVKYVRITKLTQQWENDMRHGYGLWTDNTSSYEGQWLNNMRHGFGMEKNAVRQEHYVGEFERDKRHGRGTIESLLSGASREVVYNKGQIEQEQIVNIPEEPIIEILNQPPSDDINEELAQLRIKTAQQEKIITQLGFQAQAIEALEAKLQMATNQQQNFKDQLEERSLCAICMERNKNCAFDPCGHVLCEDCGAGLNTCPFCSAAVKHKLVLFL